MSSGGGTVERQVQHKHMTVRSCSLLIAGLCLPLWVAAEGIWAPAKGNDEFNGRDLRKAVQAQRVVERDELQREEAWAGKRLTPLELAQLREQVRQQWPGRMSVYSPAESRPLGRVVSTPVSNMTAP